MTATHHIAIATVRDPQRKIIAIDTLCGLTITGEDLTVGETTCPTCIRRNATY